MERGVDPPPIPLAEFSVTVSSDVIPRSMALLGWQLARGPSIAWTTPFIENVHEKN